jgi:DNA-directed RNA polymerase specialized sigma24 family protein
MAMTWYQIYQEDPDWLAWYRREFDRKLGGLFEDPEDACSSAIYKLLFEKLPKAKPKHRDNMEAFVRATYRNVLEDTRRAFFGRPRVPTKMKLIGPPIDQIYFAFCLLSKPVSVISTELVLKLEVVSEWVTWLKKNNKCPKKVKKISLTVTSSEGETRQSDLTADEGDPVGDEVESDELGSLMDLLLNLREEPADRVADLSASLADKVADMRSSIEISDEERILLRCRFVEQLNVPDTAKAMNMQVHTVRNREKQILKRLRTVFTQFGMAP